MSCRIVQTCLQPRSLCKKFFLGLLLLGSSHLLAVDLTEENIEKFLLEMDSVIQALDVDGYEKMLSDDAKFLVTFVFQGRNQIVPYSREKYLREFRQGVALVDNYQFNRSDTVITITGDKAVVTTFISESATVHKRNVKSESESEMTIQVVEGELRITKTVGDLGVFTTG